MSFFIGAHVSAAGCPSKAVDNAVAIRATGFALFLSTPRRWEGKALDSGKIVRFKEKLTASGISPRGVLPHGSYLINLASSDKEILTKSRNLLVSELVKCRQLGLLMYNVHPGSCADRELGLGTLCESINYAIGEVPDVVIVVENMAGQGNVLCSDVGDFGVVVDGVVEKSRIGFCLDTAHLFGAGYDITQDSVVDKVIGDFDNTIGLEYLKAFHLNDSKVACGSKKDRHEVLGKGLIGLGAFRKLLGHPLLKDREIVFVTETTDDVAVQREEIEALKEMLL